MPTRLKLLFTAALAAVVAAPLSAQSPEFRSTDLPGAVIHRGQDGPSRSDTVEFTLAARGQPGSRLEYKVHMQAGNAMLYQFTATEMIVAEFHGESDANKAVMFYQEDAAISDGYGQFVAPMTGVHGWYLANRGDVPVTIRLTLSGYYTVTPGLIPIATPER